MKGTRYDLGDAGRIVDLDGPFGHRTEDGGVVQLLERPPAPHAAFDLADEEDQRHGIVLGDVDRMRGVGGAWTARHHGDARPSREPRHRIGHHASAGFLAAHRQGDVRVVQRVEHREIALARHAEHVVHTLSDELRDEDLAAGAGLQAHEGCLVRLCRRPRGPGGRGSAPPCRPGAGLRRGCCRGFPGGSPPPRAARGSGA